MQKLLILSGVALLLIFVIGGQYMRDFVPLLEGSDAVQRMAWRANHIYLMFAGLIHLLWGLFWVTPTHDWGGKAQLIGSAIIILAGPVLVYAWLHDPVHGGMERGWSAIGLFMTLGGGLLVAIAGLKKLRDK